MTVQTLARRPQIESPWERVDQSREEYHRQRDVALRAYEEALEKPEAQTALAVRAAASAATSAEIGDIAAKWVDTHAAGQVVAHVPAEDQARVIFQIQAVRELAAERQKRLARRLGDIVALGADALKNMDIESIRERLTESGYPIRRVRDAIFALKVYRSAIAAPVDKPLRMLNLFAGIDAATFAASLIGDGKRIQTVAVAEIKPYPIAVMARHYPSTPNLGDVAAIDWASWQAGNGQIDILTAGFPCQDFSRAGKKKGLKGEKSSLFFEVIRAAETLRPKYLLLENVEGIFDRDRRRDLLTIIRKCRQAGYALDIAGLDASDYGLPMLRPRFYAIGVRRDLVKWLPRRKAWRYHDMAPRGAERMLADMGRNPAEPLSSLKAWKITQYSTLDGRTLDGREVAKLDRPTGSDKGVARRLGIDLDARTDIGKALHEARRMRPRTPEEIEAYRKEWVAANPGKVAEGKKPPKDKDVPWVEIRRPRFGLLGGLVSVHHVPQPSWLGDVIDCDPPASLWLNHESLRQVVLKWGAAKYDETVDGKPPKVVGKPGQQAFYDLDAFKAGLIPPPKEGEPPVPIDLSPLDLAGIEHPMAHGISYTLHQRGKGYGLGGMGIRPHSMYTVSTHSGWGVVQEGRARRLSHDEMDILMGFPRGYSYAPEMDGNAAKAIGDGWDDRQIAIGNGMAVPCIQAALEGCLIAELALRGM